MCPVSAVGISRIYFCLQAADIRLFVPPPPRWLLGVSWVPPRCSWVPPGCFLGVSGCFLDASGLPPGGLLAIPGTATGKDTDTESDTDTSKKPDTCHPPHAAGIRSSMLPPCLQIQKCTHIHLYIYIFLYIYILYIYRGIHRCI